MVRESIKKIFLNESVDLDIRTYLKVLKKEHWPHIHYGYWTNDQNNSFAVAQNNLYDLLKINIQPNVEDILDIGGGVGGVSQMLVNDGYHCKCVVPDGKLIEYGKSVNPQVDFLLARAEDFKIDKKYDLAILIESYQYFNSPRQALINIINHLSDDGQIIILDEFDFKPLILNNTLDNLINWLEESKYYLVEKKNISKNILPTCDYLINYFKDNNYIKMSEQWSVTKDRYIQNRRKYFLLVFDKYKK